MIKVLIVDDSMTIRKLIRNILDKDPELIVVDEARNGEEAVELCAKLDPDIITMDIQMPRMDGYEAIRHIMSEYPRPIVVLTSSESEIKHGVAFKGIEAGALMVIRKPRGLLGEDPEAEKLVSQVKAMAGVKVIRRRWDMTKQTVSHPRPAKIERISGSYQILAIGASTGGPPALRTILAHLTGQWALPVVIVQHISRGFVKGLARWLNETTPLRVKVAEDREILQGGTVYLAPDDRHFQVSKGNRAWLMDSDPMDGHRPSVTELFESVARSYGSSAVGVLLTGMGRDGASGLKDIKNAGGYTIAQDEESAIVFGMPKEAIAMGAANEVLSLDQIGRRLINLLYHQQKQQEK